MENVKIPFTHRRTVKVVCWCLSVVCVIMITIGAFTAALASDDDWLGYHPETFHTSSYVSARISQLNWHILNYVLNQVAAGESADFGSDVGLVNLFYSITDENGEVVADNFIPGVELTCITERTYPHYDRKLYTIKDYLRSTLRPGDGYFEAKQVYDWTQEHCITLFVLAGIAALLLIACFIVLLCGAGHKQGVEGYTLSALNRKLPLDLHFACCAALCSLAGYLLVEGVGELLYQNPWAFTVFAFILAVLCTIAFCMVAMHFLVCFAARCKGGKWWRCTLIYRILHWCWRVLKKLLHMLVTAVRNLPIIWRSVLVFCCAALLEIILALLARLEFFAFLLLVAYNMALLIGVIYLAMQLRRLQKGGVALAAGDLSYKVDTAGMFWDFKRHAECLNSISDGMNRAVNARMKSERFKTELITNVSHDIKTPLTSIINYVDLLKKQPPGGEETAEYLEVLERQSARLKKLTEDLVEASKASSGALNVELAPTDVCELLRQAAGEYDHRIRAAQLQTVITTPEHKVDIICDGRLLWRVFDNLLSNICKYSQPDTRSYLSVDEDEERAWIMLRNISREVLNIKAEELMERFVRGDSSRSTEGSGLGLSIARSLTELQGGTFRLFVDGDLFKAILTFPKAK